jgi:hypothetical protein
MKFIARLGLAILIVVVGVFILKAIIYFRDLPEKRMFKRDFEREVTLHGLRVALEFSYKETGSYPIGTFFSVWDNDSGRTTNYWSRGNPPESTALYDALVDTGLFPSLLLDPINREGGDSNLLGDGPPIDQGYVYWSDNGQRYIVGTNLEKLRYISYIIYERPEYGNYQI